MECDGHGPENEAVFRCTGIRVQSADRTLVSVGSFSFHDCHRVHLFPDANATRSGFEDRLDGWRDDASREPSVWIRERVDGNFSCRFVARILREHGPGDSDCIGRQRMDYRSTLLNTELLSHVRRQKLGDIKLVF